MPIVKDILLPYISIHFWRLTPIALKSLYLKLRLTDIKCRLQKQIMQISFCIFDLRKLK